jgi:hypothetical protein
VFKDGLGDVSLWVDEPYFDHVPRILEAELFDPATKSYVMGIYREDGWISMTNPVRAKVFLEQDEGIRNRVWEEISNSLISWECPVPMAHQQDSALLRNDYELSCETHWKRFLLEIDLKKETVELIAPLVCYQGDERIRGLALRESTALSSLFLDCDLARPYLTSDHSLKHLEINTNRIF